MHGHDHFVSINGLQLHYIEWGRREARSIVLLHGGSAHAHWWDFFAPAIAGDFHVIAVDLRGHGDSEHAQPPAYGVADYAADLAAFMQRLGADRIDLVGHSLGGMVATVAGAQAPERIRSVVIVDSALRITAAGARYMTRLQRFPQPLYRSREEAITRFRLLPTHTVAPPQVLAHVAAHGVRPLPDGRWTFKFDRAAMAANEPEDFTPALQRLHCPILFVRATHSTLLTPAALAHLLSAAPHARSIEIAEAYHHVMLDRPDEFARVVSGFLRSAM